MANKDPNVAKSKLASDGLALRIRRARRSDLAALTAFNRAMAWETERKRLNRKTLAAGVAGPFDNPSRGFYVVAECGGKIVGALLITFEWSDWRNAVYWWIQSVYVVPKYRGRGVYRRLYEYVRQEAARSGKVCGLRLYVEKTNRAARAVYKKLGMKESHYVMYETEDGVVQKTRLRPAGRKTQDRP